MAKTTTPNLTPRTLELFLAYARDAGNWSGTPLVGGNVGSATSKEDRGNITQMKRAGLVTTFVSDGHTWLSFTLKGALFAAAHGVSNNEMELPFATLQEVIRQAGQVAPEDYDACFRLAGEILAALKQ